MITIMELVDRVSAEAGSAERGADARESGNSRTQNLSPVAGAVPPSQNAAPALCSCGEEATTTYEKEPVCENCYEGLKTVEQMSWAEYYGY